MLETKPEYFVNKMSEFYQKVIVILSYEPKLQNFKIQKDTINRNIRRKKIHIHN